MLCWPKPREAELQDFIGEIATDCGDIVDFPEFLSLMAPMVAAEGVDEDLRAALVFLDRDGNGFASAAELRHAMMSVDGDLPDGELDVTDAALRPQDEMALSSLVYVVADPTFAHLRPAAGECLEWMIWASSNGY